MSLPNRLRRTTPWRLAGAVERRLTRRMTRPLPRPVDGLLVKLSRSADRSVLWVALAGAFALVGGLRGRRAAHRGLLALAVTSAAVNGPMKLLFGRQRPAPRRRLRHTPRTSSFPSGHSASAFAFAVAATRELPEAGPMLLPLAAGVAYSRVYLGVHYPSDVVAGAAFGAAGGMRLGRQPGSSEWLQTRSPGSRSAVAVRGGARSEPARGQQPRARACPPPT